MGELRCQPQSTSCVLALPHAANMLASMCVWQLLAHGLPLSLHVSASALLGAHTSFENTYLHATAHRILKV